MVCAYALASFIVPIGKFTALHPFADNDGAVPRLVSAIFMH